MSDPASTPQKKVQPPRIFIMGVGGSGVRAVDAMCRANPALAALAVDTDARTLETVEAAQTLLVGESVTSRFSAGGDVELGRQAIVKDSSGIRKILRQADLLLIVAGLGGGTASGAVPVITRIAREAGAMTLCLLTLPFRLEGGQILAKAEDALKKIRPNADAIVRIPNEALVDGSEADLTVEQAFARGRETIESGASSLWRLLTEDGICGLDFSCVQTMLRNCDGFCHFACAESRGEGRADAVAEAILGHPLLAKGAVLGKSAGIIVGLTGGHDLKLSEMEQVMRPIQEKLPEGAWVNFGVAVDPAFDQRLSATMLVAEQWKEPLVDEARRKTGFRGRAAQGELPFEIGGKGSFSGLDPTILDNQDLDVPTYIRRGIKLPR